MSFQDEITTALEDIKKKLANHQALNDQDLQLLLLTTLIEEAAINK